VSCHPSAFSTVAKQMLSRIKEDVGGYAKQVSHNLVPRIKSLLDKDIIYFGGNPKNKTLNKVIKKLEILVKELGELQRKDGEYVEKVIFQVQEQSNKVDIPKMEKLDEISVKKYIFLLNRIAKQKPLIDINFIAGTIISVSAEESILRINPYIENVPDLISAVGSLMFHSNRVSQANRAIILAHSLRILLLQLQQSGDSSSTGRQLLRSSGSIAQDTSWTSTKHTLGNPENYEKTERRNPGKYRDFHQKHRIF